jgi:hypothetical protein
MFYVSECPWELKSSSGRLKKRLCWSRWNDVSKCLKSIRTHFLHLGHWKMRIARSYLSDDFSRRITLRNHNLPSGRLKKQLSWSRWSDIWMCLKAIRAHFLQPQHGKKRLGWIGLSDVLSSRKALRSHNLPFGVLKYVFGEVDEAVFQCVERRTNSFSATRTSKKATWMVAQVIF